MNQFDINRARRALQEFQFSELFLDYLGWNAPKLNPFSHPSAPSHRFTPIAELGGVLVLEVGSPTAEIPPSPTRMAIQQAIAERYHENILIFVDGARQQSSWLWVKREGNKKYPRTHSYLAGQSGDLMLSKLGSMFVDMSELDDHGRVPITRAAALVRDALDIERVTKKFYDQFKEAHNEFLTAIQGIDEENDRRWYASVLLNRLMFIYFLQRKGLVNHGHTSYLQEKLSQMKQVGEEAYYRPFLTTLFFEGFAKPPEQRSPEARALLGEIRYLNGGLFLTHPIELKWPTIQIPNTAFDKLFAVFGRYSWNLNDSPTGQDDEINPDVLGYIFEKYINQKAFGAYYTPTEITEYLCEQTIHTLILDKMGELNLPSPPTPLPKGEGGKSALSPWERAGGEGGYESVPDLLSRMDGVRCRQLLHDVLPSLSLLDPSCGSGAFLVAAMKTLLEVYRAAFGRMAALPHDTALQQYKTAVQRDHPNLDYFIKKRIITDNLYGVDIMPEAVEIARLRLFLALVSSVTAETEMEPLPNIDFNILAGNSLIGLLRVDEERFNTAVPLSLSQAQPQAPLQQKSFFPRPQQSNWLTQQASNRYRQIMAEKSAMLTQYRHTAEHADLRDNAEAVQALRQKIEAHRQENAAVLNQILLEEFWSHKIQYEQATWDDKAGKLGKPSKKPLTLDHLNSLHPFHWGYEFYEVMQERGGFDGIITNPPWEIWKPQAKEFFAEYAEVVTKNKMTIKEFEKEQASLLQNEETRAAWLAYLSRFPHVSAYFRAANQYQHQTAVVDGRRTGSDINLYKLFTEQCYNLLRKGGLCGTVIPSGIYTDLGATGLRQMLFGQTEIQGLFGFENRQAIFEGVHRSFKFVVLTFRKGGTTASFPATFMRHDPAALRGFPANGLPMSVELVRRLSPGPLSLMEFTHPLDVQIAQKMLRFPLLGEEVAGAWQLSFTREFDMTNDSGIFRTEPAEGRLPLYEGKMIHQFDHNFAQPRYWVDEAEGRAAVLGKRQDTGQMLDYQTYRLGFRSVAASTNERTLICTIIPNAFHGNSLPTIVTYEDGQALIDWQTQLCISGLLNSFIADWQLRQRVSANINHFYVYQLAIPRLTAADPAFAPIVQRAAQLICTTPAFDGLAHAIGLGDHTAGVTDPARRAQLRAELDALVAHLYALTAEEFAYILSTFPLVAEESKTAALAAYHTLHAQSS